MRLLSVMTVAFSCAVSQGFCQTAPRLQQQTPAPTAQTTLQQVMPLAQPSASPTPPQVGQDGLIHLEAKPEMIELVPTFAVLSIARSVEFYVNRLGFSVVLQSGNYVAVGRDTVQIGLVQDKNAPRGYKPTCYIRMVRIDAYYQQIRDRGVRVTGELVTRTSKMREFSVTDPDGFVLVFGEYTGN